MQASRSSELWRQVRFLVTGAINTGFGYSIFAILILLSVPYALALLIATVLGVVFNFFTFGGYVFKRMRAGDFPRFVAVYAALYVVNVGLLRLLVDSGLHALAAQLVCLAFVAPLTYLLLKNLVFRGGTTE